MKLLEEKEIKQVVLEEIKLELSDKQSQIDQTIAAIVHTERNLDSARIVFVLY